MCGLLKYRLIIVLIALSLFSGLCWAEDSFTTSNQEVYVITESELNQLMNDSQKAREELQTSKDNYEKSEISRQELETILNNEKEKYTNLLTRFTDLENRLDLSEQESTELKNELKALTESFNEFVREVNSRLLKAKIKAFFEGLAIGIAITYAATNQ